MESASFMETSVATPTCLSCHRIFYDKQNSSCLQRENNLVVKFAAPEPNKSGHFKKRPQTVVAFNRTPDTATHTYLLLSRILFCACRAEWCISFAPQLLHCTMQQQKKHYLPVSDTAALLLAVSCFGLTSTLTVSHYSLFPKGFGSALSCSNGDLGFSRCIITILAIQQSSVLAKGASVRSKGQKNIVVFFCKFLY